MGKVRCETCKFFGVRTCCDRLVCAKQVWDDHAFEPGSDEIDDFLAEYATDCREYRRDPYYKEEFTRNGVKFNKKGT